jgi:hypothetical protein
MRRIALFLACAWSIAGARPSTGADDLALAVIVHPSRSEPLTVADIARIYLRKRRFWADGTPIVPLNVEIGSRAREVFSLRVLGSDTLHLATYWNEAYFDGVLPPTVLGSTDAIRRYVASEPRAIGYVPEGDADGSVRVVLVLAPPKPSTTGR